MSDRPDLADRGTLRPLSTSIRRTRGALPGPSSRTATIQPWAAGSSGSTDAMLPTAASGACAWSPTRSTNVSAPNTAPGCRRSSQVSGPLPARRGGRPPGRLQIQRQACAVRRVQRLRPQRVAPNRPLLGRCGRRRRRGDGRDHDDGREAVESPTLVETTERCTYLADKSVADAAISLAHRLLTGCCPIRQGAALLQPETVKKPAVASLQLVPAMQPSTIIDNQQVARPKPDASVTEPHGKQALEELQGPAACTCRTHQRIPGGEIEPLPIPHWSRLKHLSRQLRRHMLLDFLEGFGLVAHQ